MGNDSGNTGRRETWRPQRGGKAKERQANYLRAFERSRDRADAAEAAGVSVGAVQKWRSTDPEFAQAEDDIRRNVRPARHAKSDDEIDRDAISLVKALKADEPRRFADVSSSYQLDGDAFRLVLSLSTAFCWAAGDEQFDEYVAAWNRAIGRISA